MTQDLLRSRPDWRDQPEPVGYTKESPRLPWHRKASFLGSLAIVLALYIAYLLRPPFAPPYIARLAPISASGRAKFGPIVTDGRDVYFLELVGGHQSLARVPASGGDSTLLPSSLDNLQLADISPDGRELLVGTRVGTQSEWPLWKVSLEVGLPVTRLGSLLGHAATYSPNGEQVAYGVGYDLYLANNDGSEPKLLTSTAGVVRWIRWSPDGSVLRFTLLNPQNRTTSLWEVASSGRNLRPLLAGWNNPSWECCGNWTSDGKYFVFQSTRNWSSQIWAIREKSELFRKRDPLPVQLTSGPVSYRGPVPSRDGRRILVVGDQQRSELLRYNPAANQFEPFLGGLSAESLDFSRDGEWVAFVGYPDGALWRCRVDGTERLRLTPASLRVYLPRWSPDGTQLAFRAESASLPVKIYTVSADGKQLKQLFSDGRNEADPSWSSDGKKMAFGRTALPYESHPKAIHVYDFESGQTSTLPGSEGLFSPRWSPDGRHIAAMSLDSQRLMLFDRETEDWQELARVNASYPTWSLDSKTLYLGAKVNNRQGQYRINVAEKKLERMVSLPETFHEVVSFALWSGMAPNGSLIVARDLSRQEIFGLEWQTP
jgi:Tol biopolymer transport system component